MEQANVGRNYKQSEKFNGNLMKPKVIVFIESNTSGTGKIFFETCHDLGFIPLILSINQDQYSFSKEIGTWRKIKDHSKKTIHASIIEIERHFSVMAITSTSDYYIEVASMVANMHNLKGEVPGTVMICRNKFEMRNKISQVGLCSPRFSILNKNNPLKSLKKDDFPIVIKPINGSGSKNVVLCKAVDELKERITEIFESLPDKSSNHHIMIEQFIHGEEFSAEIFNGRIIGITKKYLGKLPYFVETGHDFPVLFNLKLRTVIQRSLSRIIQLFCLNFGPYHIEFKINDNRFWLIEINPRLAGGFIPSLIKNAKGIDLIKATLQNLTGSSPSIRPIVKQYSSIRFIVPKTTGYLTSITIPTAEHEDSFDYLIYKQTPFLVDKMHHDFNDRIGHIITKGKSAEKATKQADDIIEKVKLRFHLKLIL
jgi:biotin carboxylase